MSVSTDGIRVLFSFCTDTDTDYRQDLGKDVSPYKMIYDGYEHKWAHYKVYVMVIKLFLVLPVVVFVNTSA